MNTYDFDRIIPRRNSGSYKWDTPSDPQALPLWVADMDFATAPEIIEALRRRVDHGVFGYTYVGDEYYRATTDWFARRHGLQIDRNDVIYTSGVVPAISAILKAVAEPGDKVIVQTPAYNCFFSSIRNDELQLASNPLVHHPDGTYTIDFEGFEELARDPKAKVLLLCNPHNPSGRCWTPEELTRLGRIAIDNGLFIIADEIHCELVYPPRHYTPFASLSREFALHSATCISPSKAFNIAGLQIANIVAPDTEIRARIDRAININEVCDVNPFGVVATVAAYTKGEPWLEQLLAYLKGNYDTLAEIIAKETPAYRLTPLEATYLAWLDITPSGMTSAQLADKLMAETHLMINPGTLYGPEGEGFLRINLAAPRSVIIDAANRLVSVLAQF